MNKIIVVVALFLLLSGCYNDKADQLYPPVTAITCDTTTITYTHDIAPILTANCNISGGCHDAAGKATSGYDYTTYTDVATSAEDGNLVNDINWTPTRGHNNMPKNGSKLGSCDINKITRWVNLGYQNN